MIRLRPSGVDEILIKRVRDWYEPGPGIFIQSLTASFSPAMLFTGTTQGAWYDPSDTTTLYRDAAGTLPVTAVEQPVGLMLDKRDTAYSTYFDGTGDYLTAVNGGNFEFGVNNFTVECWIYNSSVSGSTGYAGVWSQGAQSWILYRESNTYKFFHTNPATNFSFTTSAVTGEWTHIAVVRDGATIKAYVNGIASGSLSIGATAIPVYNSTPLCIGANLDPSPGAYLTGYISNLRIVKGAALYTANFTPPTSPLTAVAGTSLLTCGTSWSGNPALTTVGNTRADKLNPFTTGTGNHAFNSSGNSANFPVLSARYNLLTKTEDFLDAVWTKRNSTATGSVITASTSVSTDHSVAQTVSGITGSLTATIDFKSGTSNFAWLCLAPTYGLSNYATAVVDLSSGTVSKTQAAGTVSIVSSAIGSVDTDGYRRLTFSVSSSGSGITILAGIALSGTPIINSYGGVDFIAAGTETISVRKADLRVANDALNQPAYQRVNTSTDYDTAGFKPYLNFNGTNQWLQTNSIDFTYGDKMFVSAGVRKLSDAASGVIIESSTNPTANSGTFGLFAPNNIGAAGNFAFFSRGTSNGVADGAISLSPITKQLSGIGNISGDQTILRVNGAQAVSGTADQGTGNYGTYPLYIGARAGTSVWFNGRLYQMVVAGKQASAAEITSTETYLNQKTGAY